MSVHHILLTASARAVPRVSSSSLSPSSSAASRFLVRPLPPRPYSSASSSSPASSWKLSHVRSFSSSPSSSSASSRWQRFLISATSRFQTSPFNSSSSASSPASDTRDPSSAAPSSSSSNPSSTASSDAKNEPMIGFSTLLKVADRERALIGLALTAQLVSASAMLLFPLAMGNIVDTVTGSSSSVTDLTKLVGVMGGVFILSGLATAARVSTMSLAGSRISRDLRVRLYHALLSQDTAFFDVRKTGELINRLSNDVPQVSRTLTDNLAKVLRSGVTATSSLGLIIYLSPKLALITSLSIPPIALFASIFGRNARYLSRALVDALAAATQVAAERTAAIRTVRTFGAERSEASRYANKVDETYGLARKVAFADGVYAGSVQLAAQMSLLGVLWFGGRMVLDPQDAMTIGALTSFSMYAVNLGISVASVGTAYGQLTRALGSAFRIFEVIDRTPQGPSSTLASSSSSPSSMFSVVDEADVDNNVTRYGATSTSTTSSAWSPLPSDQPSTTTTYTDEQCLQQIHHWDDIDTVVQFRDVTFTYPTRPESLVLRGVDLTISPGEIIGVAGASGSGKSTLSSLLLRLYEPQSGSITLGGHSIHDVDTRVLRRLVSVVSQEPVLFSGTIADNIRYGTPVEKLPMDNVMQAAKDAASHDMIMSLPQGYHTPVGERGTGLSGGQRARVALARALARKPRVVVLDEHSAALDAESERAVAVAVRHAAKDLNIAILSIAHRSSSLRRADRIAVLVDGIVKEMDSFDNLMNDRNSALRKMLLPGSEVDTADANGDMVEDTEHSTAQQQQQQQQRKPNQT